VRPERCWPLAVGRDCGIVVVWCWADGRVWPVKCPHSSAVGCGVPPAAHRRVASTAKSTMAVSDWP
jgi:hypothetical protein